MDTFIWVIISGIALTLLVGIVIVLERSRNTHKTIAESVQEERDALRLKVAALEARAGTAFGQSSMGQHLSDVTAKLGLDTSQFHAGLDKATAALEEFKAKGQGLDEFLQRLWNARVSPDGKLELAPAAHPGTQAGNSNLSPIAAADSPVTWGLPDVLIDRDDLMKHITNDFPQPVLLDDVPVHNGLGEALNYWTWPGKGIRNTKPEVAASPATPGK